MPRRAQSVSRTTCRDDLQRRGLKRWPGSCEQLQPASGSVICSFMNRRDIKARILRPSCRRPTRSSSINLYEPSVCSALGSLLKVVRCCRKREPLLWRLGFLLVKEDRCTISKLCESLEISTHVMALSIFNLPRGVSLIPEQHCSQLSNSVVRPIFIVSNSHTVDFDQIIIPRVLYPKTIHVHFVSHDRIGVPEQGS
jgi:hypothetical protein